jgi:hypothetical protein
MPIKGLRRSREMVEEIVFFGRTLDKIRLADTGLLPEGYNLGTGFDENLCGFLNVAYTDLRDQTLQGGTDEQILVWCFATNGRPHSFAIRMWNHYVLKLGRQDETSEALARTKEQAGMSDRDDVQTWCDFHDADEGWI